MAIIAAYGLLDITTGALGGVLGVKVGEEIVKSYGLTGIYKSLAIAGPATAFGIAGLYAGKPFIDKANEPLMAKQGEEVLAIGASVATAAAMYKTLELTAKAGAAIQYASTLLVGPITYGLVLVLGRYVQDFFGYIAKIFSGKKDEKDKEKEKEKEKDKDKKDKKDKEENLNWYQQLMRAFGLEAHN